MLPLLMFAVASSPDPCPTLAEAIDFLGEHPPGRDDSDAVLQPPIMDGDIRIQEIIPHWQKNLEKCATSEGMWYETLWALENTTCAVPADIVEEAGKRFPRSPYIATIRARRLKTLAAAETASAIDMSYVPAQVLLSEAHYRQGNFERALEIISKVRDIKRYRYAPLLKASILFELGRFNDALKAAKLEPKNNTSLYEPVLCCCREDRRSVIGRTYLALGQIDSAAKALIIASAMGDQKARDILIRSEGPLRTALVKAARTKGKDLLDDDRATAQAILSEIRPSQGNGK